jgi:NDP-sugar pyrophosphorylase family protein
LKPGDITNPPSIKTAVVLAGGEGLRLRPLTSDKPKVMISVAGKPILDWILQWLVGNRISRIVVGVAYKKDVVTQYVRRLNLPARVEFSEHTVEGGTGEGFRLAIERFVQDDTFLAMNGDEITDINISEFADFHIRSGSLATIAVANLRSPFGVVKVSNDKIVEFREKAVLESWVSTGIYTFNHRILEYLPVRGNIEDETFPKLAGLGKLGAFRHSGFWGTLNTLKDLHELEKELTRGILST